MTDNDDETFRSLFASGTPVVVLREITGPNGQILHPWGAVGTVIKCPQDLQHSYRVRFPDGVEESLLQGELTSLSKFKASAWGEESPLQPDRKLFDYVAYQCVVGSQAYGLADGESDVDRRGFYVPPAEMHWSLFGVPEQLECHETQEAYWEIQKFLMLALKANPNVLEALYSPIVEKASPIAQDILEHRQIFLSRLVYQTYNGYVLSQFKKMQADIRNQGRVKWKHVMHLIRLLLSGIRTLNEGVVPVLVDEHREKLLAIKRGEVAWEETEAWRIQLHAEFNRAIERTQLPERPDYLTANALLVRARREAIHKEMS